MNRFTGWLFLLLFTPALQAQQPRSSLLWEVSGNGLQQPSYLFGTFHLLCKGDFTVTPELENKLRASKQFYGELKMDDPGLLQASMLSKLMMQGHTLQSLIGETDYSNVSEKFQSITGMPITLFNTFKPFLSLSMLVQKGADCPDKVQPETEFVTVAKRLQLPVLGLETVEDQLNAIDKEPLDSQVLSLKKTILNFDSVKLVMSKMMAVYQLRDIDSLQQFITSSGGNEMFTTEMINKRNANWIPVMQSAMKSLPSFFAVGAGHLGGTAGLISLLRKEGYRVTPLKF
ncbi:MAG TPA: TraB/GumN family protein [Sediminibacterium sp.]|jgi:hypothetical protein